MRCTFETISHRPAVFRAFTSMDVGEFQVLVARLQREIVAHVAAAVADSTLRERIGADRYRMFTAHCTVPAPAVVPQLLERIAVYLGVVPTTASVQQSTAV